MLCIHFRVFVRNMLKNTKYTFFVMLFYFFILFGLHPFLAFSVPYRGISILCIVLVPNILKNIHETGFWKSRLISPYFHAIQTLVHNSSNKKQKLTFLIMFFFPHTFPEFCQNFSISVPVKMNNKKKKWYFFISLFIYLFIL